MEATRPALGSIRLPAKHAALRAVTFDQKPPSSARQHTANPQRALAVIDARERPGSASGFLREINGPVFTSSATRLQSSQFLAQQIAQYEDAHSNAFPAPTFVHATSAYDNTLGLTATVLGFQGACERVA
ncbi:MAG: hypothetical protein K9G33_05920 [Sneathiella sp.]|nr:hypothetical protein [Sneathiella sp.]